MKRPARSGIALSRLLLLLVPALLILAWWLIGSIDRDRKLIEKRLSRVESQLSKKEGESLLVSAGAALKLIQHFTEDAEIEPGRPLGRILSPDDLKAAIARIRSMVTSLDVTILEQRITLDKQAGTAQVELRLKGVVSYQAQRETDTRLYDLEMRRIDGDWLISRVALRETFRRSE